MSRSLRISFALLCALVICAFALPAAGIAEEAWQTAYREFLIKLDAQDSGNKLKRIVALCDFTGDGQPELIHIAHDTTGNKTAQLSIYYYADGQVQKKQSGSSSFDFDAFSFKNIKSFSFQFMANSAKNAVLSLNINSVSGNWKYNYRYAFSQSSANQATVLPEISLVKAAKKGSSVKYYSASSTLTKAQYTAKLSRFTDEYKKKGTNVPYCVIGRADSSSLIASRFNALSKKYVTFSTASKVSLNKTSLKLSLGKTYQLKASFSPASALFDSVTWKSGNDSIVSVDANGKLTARGVGSATVTAVTSSGKTARCKVSVPAPSPISVSLSDSEIYLLKGAKTQLIAEVSPAQAQKSFKWTSSRTSVVSVDSKGNLLAKAVGESVITVRTSNGKQAACKVSVISPATSVSLNAASRTITVGNTYQLTATVSPKDAAAGLEWTSSNTSVARVNDEGLITAHGAGTATISAVTLNNKKATCKVTVTGAQTGGYIIDISHYNNVTNWDKVAASVDFIILRASCGTVKDNKLDQYAAACRERGIPFGVYCYGKATTLDEAEAEARAMYQYANAYKPLFYVYDVEQSFLTRAISSRFIATLKSLGVKKTGYYIAHHLYSKLNLNLNDVDFIWIPRYGKYVNGSYTGDATPDYPCDLHQYTSTGRVPGVSGNVDLNRLMGAKPLSWFTS